MTTNIVNFLARKFGWFIYKKNFLPHGASFYRDTKKHFPNFHFKTIIDVGANEGQSALEFNFWFPKAEIHSFEPVKETCYELRKNTGHLKNVHVYHCGLGERIERLTIHKTAFSDQNTIRETEGKLEGPSETVEIDTVDNFIEKNKISKIDLLKIDTEGFDLKVLRGAVAALQDELIPFIMVESSLNLSNDFHISFGKFQEFFKRYNYYVFGIYNQFQEWRLKRPYLRRGDIVFVSEKFCHKLIKNNQCFL